jgi:membrane-associated protease RseP (regulator of RpoE activity)
MKATARLVTSAGIFQGLGKAAAVACLLLPCLPCLACLLGCASHAVGSIGVKLARDQKTGQVRVFEAPPGTGKRAGLEVGDRIVAVDGKDVSTFATNDELRRALRGDAGTRVRLTVERDGVRRDIDVERGGPLEEQP